MKFTITLAHFVRQNPTRSGSEWFPDPIPSTLTKPAVWDTEDKVGRMVWEGYCHMEATAGRPVPELDLDGFRDALNRFLFFVQGEGRDNYQRVYRIHHHEPDTTIDPTGISFHSGKWAVDTKQLAAWMQEHGWSVAESMIGSTTYTNGPWWAVIEAGITGNGAEWKLSVHFGDRLRPNTIVGFRTPKSILDAVFNFLAKP